jgi:anhydro-N-acetylmuramic acid kinase
VTGADTRVLAVTTGTSVDALDVVVADVSGPFDGLVELRPVGHLEVPLAGTLRDAILGMLPPAATTVETVCRVDADLGRAFAAAARRATTALADGQVDVIVLLGQTVHHDVVDGTVRGTLQLGQAAAVAEATGVPVVSDLRTRDVAAGGQGAPLVSYLDVLLLRGRLSGTTDTGAIVNLGGIANLTVVPVDGDPLAFDAGPANALLDAEVRRSTDRDRDDGGALAATGTVDPTLLSVLLDDPFLAAPPPKSTGKERYHLGFLDAALDRAPVTVVADRLATLAEAVATAVVDHAARYDVRALWLGGGGVHNVDLVDRIARHADDHGITCATTDVFGLPVDAKESLAIALLGWATWHGLPGTVPACTGARAARVLGSVTPGDGPLRPPTPVRSPPTRLRVVTGDRAPEEPT